MFMNICFIQNTAPCVVARCFRLSLSLRRLVADHQRLHIAVDGVRRDTARHGTFHSVEWDDSRDARYRAEGDDVRKAGLADLAGR